MLISGWSGDIYNSTDMILWKPMCDLSSNNGPWVKPTDGKAWAFWLGSVVSFRIQKSTPVPASKSRQACLGGMGCGELVP